MHVRDLVEVAGLVALNGPLFIGGSAAVSSSYLEQYWSASRCRFDCWSRALKCHASQTPPTNFDTWIDLRSVLDEIFVSEMLTRVWTAVIVARDRRSASDAAEPIARNVLATHAEARHRALALLVAPNGFTTEQAVALNRLRRRVERWVDVLIGGLLGAGDLGQFAFEPDRARDFAVDLAERRQQRGGRSAWRLTLISLRNSFQAGLSPLAANPDANARIAAGILGCFQEELFDSTGIPRSLWMLRLAANASDAQGMIRELLATDDAPSAKSRRRRRI